MMDSFKWVNIIRIWSFWTHTNSSSRNHLLGGNRENGGKLGYPGIKNISLAGEVRLDLLLIVAHICARGHLIAVVPLSSTVVSLGRGLPNFNGFILNFLRRNSSRNIWPMHARLYCFST